MNRSKEKESKTSKGQQKESQTKKVNKSPGKDNKRTPEERSGEKPDDVSEKFPNFSLLTPEEKLVFFEALTTARKNVEKKGVRTREGFGTVHDEYLQFFNQEEKKENEVCSVQSVHSHELSSPRISRSSGEDPESPETTNLLVPEGEEEEEDTSRNYSTYRSRTLEPKHLDDYESVIQQNTDQIVNLYLNKKKKNEEKACGHHQKNREPICTTGSRRSPPKKENVETEKNRKPGPIGMSNTFPPKKGNTPRFDALSDEEKRVFFQLLQEARQNIVEKNPERKKDIVEMEAIMRGYQAGDPTTVFMVKPDDSKWPKEKKPLKVQVTVTSGDNERILKTGQLKDFFQNEEISRSLNEERLGDVFFKNRITERSKVKSVEKDLDSSGVEDSFEKLLEMEMLTPSKQSFKISSEELIPSKARSFQDFEKLEVKIGDIEEKKPVKWEGRTSGELSECPEIVAAVRDVERNKKPKREIYKSFKPEEKTEGKKPVSWERSKRGELPEHLDSTGSVGGGRREGKKSQKPLKHDCSKKKSQVAERSHSRSLASRLPVECCRTNQRTRDPECEKESSCDVHPSHREWILQKAKKVREETSQQRKRTPTKKKTCPIHPSEEEGVLKRKEKCSCEEHEEFNVKKKGRAREVHHCDEGCIPKKRDVCEEHLQLKKPTSKKKNVREVRSLEEDYTPKTKENVSEEHLSDKEYIPKKKERVCDMHEERESRREKKSRDYSVQVAEDSFLESIGTEYKVSKKHSNTLLIPNAVESAGNSDWEFREESKRKTRLLYPSEKDPCEDEKPKQKCSCSSLEKKPSKEDSCEEKKSEKFFSEEKKSTEMEESECERKKQPKEDPWEEKKWSEKDLNEEKKFFPEEKKSTEVKKCECERKKQPKEGPFNEKKSSQKSLSENEKKSEKDLCEEEEKTEKDSREKKDSEEDLWEEKKKPEKNSNDRKKTEKELCEEKENSEKDSREEDKRSEENPRCREEQKSEKDPRCEGEQKSEKNPRCEEEQKSEKDPRCEEEQKSEKDPRCEEEQKSEKDPRCEEEQQSEKDPRCEEEQKLEKDPRCGEEQESEKDPRCGEMKTLEIYSCCEKEQKLGKDLCSEEKKVSERDQSKGKKMSEEDLCEGKKPSKLNMEKKPSKRDASLQTRKKDSRLHKKLSKKNSCVCLERKPSKKESYMSVERKLSRKDSWEYLNRKRSRKDSWEYVQKKTSKKDSCENVQKKTSKKDSCECAQKKTSKKDSCENVQKKTSRKDSCECAQKKTSKKDSCENVQKKTSRKDSCECAQKKTSKKDSCECIRRKPSAKDSRLKKKTSRASERDSRVRKKASREDDNKVSELPTTMNKIMIVDDNVINKIRKLILYLEAKTKKNGKYEKEYMQLVVDYIEYLSKVLESLIHKKECQRKQLQSVYATPVVHLKFRDSNNVKKPAEMTAEPTKEEKEKVPRSISETGVSLFKNISPLSTDREKDKTRPPVPDPRDSESSDESDEDIQQFAPPITPDRKLVTTRIRLLQDLLRQRAEFVEGSIEDFKIVLRPEEEECVPQEKPPSVKVITEEDEDTGPKEHKFLKALVRCFTCGRMKYEEEGVFENLKGEAVRVDVTEGTTRDPANITLNQSTMEVLKASARKKIIEKYYSKV